ELATPCTPSILGPCNTLQPLTTFCTIASSKMPVFTGYFDRYWHSSHVTSRGKLKHPIAALSVHDMSMQSLKR
ncbi:MAG: hypothetical protein ACLQBA_08145, partial [Candidatus Binataceae bacterium]